MIELNPIQIKILQALIFPEPFDTLVEEIKASQPVIGAELKALIVLGLVTAVEEDSKGRFKSSIYYDSDNMRAFCYQTTARGLEFQEE